jgi:Ala-tRNA(Pro) deacylase
MAANRVREFVREHDVAVDTHTHDRAITAQQMAAAEHQSGWRVAKPVLLTAEGRLVMAVVPAPMLVDLDLAAEALGTEGVRLAREEEFAPRFDDCEVGAEPVFGNLYDVPVVVEQRVTEQPRIRFAAGSYTESLEVATDDFLRLADAKVASVGVLADRPAPR